MRERTASAKLLRRIVTAGFRQVVLVALDGPVVAGDLLLSAAR